MSRNPRIQKAFTLIELLVVVAIIVILVAILVPALNAALSASKLAACGAHQHGIGNGINLYASSNKQRYPKRHALEQWQAGNATVGGVGNVQPLGVLRLSLQVGGETGAVDEDGSGPDDGTGDDRPLYAEYCGLDLFEDPSGTLGNVDHPDTYRQGESVFAGLDLWWDSGFQGYATIKTMRDKVTYRRGGSDAPGTGTNNVPLLAMDRNQFTMSVAADDLALLNPGDGWFRASHNDTRKRLKEDVLQSKPSEEDGFNTRFWVVWWTNTSTIRQTDSFDYFFDLNYLYTDGSVSTLRQIDQTIEGLGADGTWSVNTKPKDERMWIAPSYPVASRYSELYTGRPFWEVGRMLLPKQ